MVFKNSSSETSPLYSNFLVSVLLPHNNYEYLKVRASTCRILVKIDAPLIMKFGMKKKIRHSEHLA